MRPPLWVVAALVAAAVAVVVWQAMSPSRSPAGRVAPGAELVGDVERVVDGDTIRVSLDGRSERVRYIGVDTPESRPGSPVECFAAAASDFNRRLVRGERVLLRTDAEPRDRYGRLLAYVHRSRDGTFVNLELVRRGYAMVLTVPPNVSHAAALLAAQRRARREGAGLWSACR